MARSPVAAQRLSGIRGEWRQTCKGTVRVVVETLAIVDQPLGNGPDDIVRIPARAQGRHRKQRLAAMATTKVINR